MQLTMRSVLHPLGSAVLATALIKGLGSAFVEGTGAGELNSWNVVRGVVGGTATGVLATPLFIGAMQSLKGGLCLGTGFAVGTFTSAVMTGDWPSLLAVNALASLILFGVYYKCGDLRE